MKHVKVILDKIKKSLPTVYALEFKRKGANSGYRVTEQDKKHIRIIATLKFARDGVLQDILDHEFTEQFKYIKEREVVAYIVTLKKEGDHKEYAHC